MIPGQLALPAAYCSGNSSTSSWAYWNILSSSSPVSFRSKSSWLVDPWRSSYILTWGPLDKRCWIFSHNFYTGLAAGLLFWEVNALRDSFFVSSSFCWYLPRREFLWPTTGRLADEVVSLCCVSSSILWLLDGVADGWFSWSFLSKDEKLLPWSALRYRNFFIGLSYSDSLCY